MNLPRAWWGGVVVFMVVSVCVGQTPSTKNNPPPAAGKSAAPSKAKQPDWKNVVQQASEADRKGNYERARTLLNEAYRLAPAGPDRAQVAFEIASACEKQKAYDEARRWYLQAIYDAPKGPLATKARERMRAIPDSRRPAAAGATSTGGNPGKPK